MSSTNATHGYPTEDAFLQAVPYHYVPTMWICAMFLGLFSITTIIHLCQAMWYHIWWLLPTAVIAGLGEIIGWTARLWSSQNPLKMDPFLMQYVSFSIIAPTPLIATNFILLARIISRLGPQYSRLSPKLYSIIFLGCDLIALTVQAVGGAKASDAASNNQDPDGGGHIMLGGIFFQMAALTLYTILAAEFLTRYNMNKPVRPGTGERGKLTQRLKLQLLGVALMTGLIFIRSIYRTIELIDGWSGTIISTQWYFNAFDGAMVFLAMVALNLFHPGLLLREPGQQFRTDLPAAEQMAFDIRGSQFSPVTPELMKGKFGMAVPEYANEPAPFSPHGLKKKFEEPLEE
ncbi:RTA1-domain-containing protein [Hysterangium stoloniferum]|nr:RTA1-domain-containing protein [Hysterangium stoloniferum]